MFHHARKMTILTMFGAMALSAPAVARDLIIVNGPIKARDVVCRSCVDTRDIRGSAVTTSKIQNNAVTSGKIRDGEVGAADIRNGAIGTDKIQNGAVTTPKIPDGAITASKLAPGLLDALPTTFASTFYITLDGDGATETIATNGPLTYFARCRLDQGGGSRSVDRVEIVATSSVDGWFEEGESDGSEDNRPLEAEQLVVANDREILAGGRLFDSLSETSMVAPDGSYLALEGDAGGMGLNIFDHDCLVVGIAYSFKGSP